MSFHKIGFIGFGLIGGSIAQKIKQNNPSTEIIATAGHVETIEEAFQMQLISNSTLLPLEAFADCDTIFLCAPVRQNLDYLQKLKDIIQPNCCITDVGSTKSDIHQEVIRLGLESQFIGGHPMTGSEKTGIRSANASILQNAYYIITPTAATTEEKLQEFEAFVKSLGSIPMILDYKVHDHATASISHLPHIIAYALVHLVSEIDDASETMKRIAAGGFKDITRIASSSPIMWQNICHSNREQILELTDLYMEQLQQVRDYIDQNDKEALLSYFQSSKDYRDSLTVPGSKRRKSVYEIFLNLEDEAGELAIVASILAAKGISIKNIGIIHNREFEDGVLRIEFYNNTAIDQAEQLLSGRGYTIIKRV